jgi:hypothetical protein
VIAGKLAALAKALLDGKEKLHDLVGSLGGRIAGMFGAEAVERTVAKELAKKIPSPWSTRRRPSWLEVFR